MSLIIAMRNEESSIGPCIRSIDAQNYPIDRLEVWIFDGGSTDRSVEVAAALIQGRPGWNLGDNPKGHQAAAWNLGIRRATGDVVGIMSAHAELGPDYVREAVETLRRTGAAMVGGPVRAVGDGVVGVAVARAVTTPFGVGGATFRYLDHEEAVDTVFMGLCRVETYRRFEFDETMRRNQDDELSYRLLDAGARIVCNPRIQSSYRSRSTLVGLWRQYLDYGRWKVRVIQKHPGQVRARHLVPAALVVAFVGSGLLALVWGPGRLVLAGAVAAYAAADAIASLAASRGLPARSAVVLPVVYPILHLSYGLGFFVGLLTFRDGWTRGVVRRVLRALGRPLRRDR